MSEETRYVPIEHKIEFRVWDMERFGILQRFFNALKRWSEQEFRYLIDEKASPEDKRATRDSTLSRRPSMADMGQDVTVATAVTRSSMMNQSAIDKPELWLLNLRPQDMKALGLPDHATATRHLREWATLTRRERKPLLKADESLVVLADFADMLGNFKGVAIVFLRCVLAEDDRAFIEYRTNLGDHEGREGVEELLLFFGFPHLIG